MENIKKYILTQMTEKNLSREQAKLLLNELMEGKREPSSEDKDEPIAIIGMACRLPEADNPEEFWRNLVRGKSSIRSFPENRKKYVDKYLGLFDDRVQYSYGGYLDNIEFFDPSFFRISPKEAEFMEPEQRLFLETAWSALEDAGIAGTGIYGSRTGVFIGRDTSPKYNYKDMLDKSNELAYTGNINSIVAGRLSYILNLKGSAMMVDSACSSSLTAVHLACNALRRKEIDIAVIGGVCISYFPVTGSRGGIITSNQDKLASFDNSADGTVWGEGVSVLVLKRIQRENLNKHHVYAMIKGTAMNNDGTSNGMTAPSAESQAELIKAAWNKARVEPESITYIETHGTGTKIGDPIEIKGISEAFNAYTDKRQFCGIGAVKSNVGHNVGASGVTALMKAALCLKNKKLLPLVNFERPNHHIDFSKTAIYVNDRLTDWNPQDYPRRCGVNSFGLSGTNCHIILEESREETVEGRSGEDAIFTFSAKTKDSLTQSLKKHIHYIANNPDMDLAAYGNTLATGRMHHNYRLAVITDSAQALKDTLTQMVDHELNPTGTKDRDIFFGAHFIVMHKGEQDVDTLTEEEKDQLNFKAGEVLKEMNRSDKTRLEIYQGLCRLYVKGADIFWEKIYVPGQVSIMKLPTYEFIRKPLWPKSENTGLLSLLGGLSGQNQAGERSISHPLIDRLLAQTMEGAIYSTTFRVDTHWVLSEHKISNEYVIPGTTYLEMAAAAGKEYTGNTVSCISDVRFFIPVVCHEHETVTMQTVIKHSDKGLEFQILSCVDEMRQNKKSAWVKHCEGKIKQDENPVPEKVDLQKLSTAFPTEEKPFDIDKQAEDILLGSRWKGPCSGRISEDAILACIELEDSLKEDVDRFVMHPALLDIATSLGAFAMGYEDFYLPFSYKKIQIHKKIPSRLYVFVKRKPTHGNEIIQFNLDIMNGEGELILQIKEFSLKRVDNIRKRMLQLSGKFKNYYGIEWVEKKTAPIPANPDRLSELSAILAITDPSEGSRRLLEGLTTGNLIHAVLSDKDESMDSKHFTIRPCAESANRLLQILRDRKIELVLFIHAGLEDEKLQSIEQVQAQMESSLFLLFHLLKAVGRQWPKKKLRWMTIANQVYPVKATDTVLNPSGAALFGITRVMNEENPNLSCMSLDLGNPSDFWAISDVLGMERFRYVVASRDGKLYEQRLYQQENSRMHIEENETLIKKDGCYLVTGGMGGLALCICERLAYMYGCGNIVLTGRTPLPDKDRWEAYAVEGENPKLRNKIQSLLNIEKSGMHITYRNVDVSDYAGMKKVIHALKSKYGRIHGVIHTAGVAGDGFINHKDLDVFEDVVSPKIYGTWILDRLTRDMAMDFMILFSSIASIVASPGQSDYTSANAYMDVVACQRQRRGQKTIAINWPSWRDTGMAFDFGANKGVGIFKPLSNEEGIARFNEIVNTSWSQSIPAELNADFIPQDLNLPIEVTHEIRQEIRYRQIKSGRIPQTRSKSDYSNMTLFADDKDSFSETEKTLAKFWYDILGIQEIDVNEKFYNLGGDSLQSIQLYRKLEEAFPDVFDISDIYTYSSISKMAEHIDGLNRTEEKTDTAKTGTEPVERELDEALKQLAEGEITVEQVEKMVRMEE